MPKSSKSTIIFLFVLSCTVFAAYWQVNNHDFINFDDNFYIYENSIILEGVSTNTLLWALTSSHASNWHPITWFSHMIDVQLFGLDAGKHHLVNVLFHLLNSILLFLFFNGATKKFMPSCFISLLFALHPLHVESVAWASERKDVLSTFFMLLTLISYSRYTSRPNFKIYCLALFFFILGLMSKPMLVTLPFLLLLLDYWPLNRSAAPLDKQALKSLLYEKTPFFILAGLSSIITFLVQQQSGAVKSLSMMPLSLRIANAIVSYMGYLHKLVWPVDLTLLYPFPEFIPAWKIFTSLAALISISLAVLRVRKKHPWLTVGWLWYVGSLVPVIGLVQVGVQSMADRYTYVPMIGIFVLISFGLSEWGKVHFRSGLTLGCMVLLCFAAISWTQIGYWRDSSTLFSHAIDVTSKNYTAHNYLAKALIKENKRKEAEIQYNKALKIRPNYLEGLVNFAVLLSEQGETDKAYTLLSKASRLDPDNPKIQNNLGNIYKVRGEADRAIASYKKALKEDPKYKEALFNLATTFENKGMFSEAKHFFQQTIQIDPKFAKAYNGLGVISAKEGNIQVALDHFKKALQLQPDYLHAKKNLTQAKKIASGKPRPARKEAK